MKCVIKSTEFAEKFFQFGVNLDEIVVESLNHYTKILQLDLAALLVV